MKAKNLVLLIVVAAVLGGLAYLKSRPSSAPGAGASANGQLVLPALDKTENLNRIAEIVVAGPGSTARVSCVKGKWVAADKFGYPVRFDTVSRFLVTLSGLKVGQQIGGGAAKRLMGLLRFQIANVLTDENIVADHERDGILQMRANGKHILNFEF